MSEPISDYILTQGIINFFERAFGSYEVAEPAAGSLELEASTTSVKPEHSQLPVCCRTAFRYVDLTSALTLT